MDTEAHLVGGQNIAEIFRQLGKVLLAMAQ